LSDLLREINAKHLNQPQKFTTSDTLLILLFDALEGLPLDYDVVGNGQVVPAFFVP